MLNDRKIRILEAIINDYIETAEPIGSRTIAKKYDLGISSATIRNEMSDLEDLGFIVQPHTSAGRVPSSKGYRLYVDKLMPSKSIEDDKLNFLKSLIQSNVNQIDYLMKQTANAISYMTNYTTIITEPKSAKMRVKHFQFIPLDEKNVVGVVVTDSKIVKNFVVHTEKAPDINVLNLLSNEINDFFVKFYKTNDDSLIKDMIERNVEFSSLLKNTLNQIYNMLNVTNEVKSYTSGVKNILAFPEFNDIEKAKILFQTLEKNDVLMTIIGNDVGYNNSVQVLIGDENNVSELKDCSIVKADYKYGDNSYGNICVIGPTRMDYSQTIAILKGIINNIENVLNTLSGG